MKLIWYPFHVADYARDTAHLSMLEHGAYRLLMDHYYLTGRCIPANDEQVHRICRAVGEAERIAVQSVLHQFFTKTEDGWINDRVEGELQKSRDISSKRSKAAALRSSAHSQTPSNADANAVANDDANAEQMLDHLRTQSQSHVHKEESIADTPACPPCQHQELLAMFAKHLPMLPQPRSWEGKRMDHMRARWRWVFSSGRAKDAAEAIAWFERFFAHAAKSDFLTGRSGRWMSCDLGWLMKADNFAKVIDGNYDNREVA